MCVRILYYQLQSFYVRLSTIVLFMTLVCSSDGLLTAFDLAQESIFHTGRVLLCVIAEAWQQILIVTLIQLWSSYLPVITLQR